MHTDRLFRHFLHANHIWF